MVYHFCSFPLSYFHNVASTGLLVPKRILGLTWFNHDFTKRLPLVGWFFPSLLLNPPPTWQASSASSHCWPFTANCTEMWTVQKTLSFTQRDDSWNVLWKGDVMDMNHQNQWFIIYGMLIIKIIGLGDVNHKNHWFYTWKFMTCNWQYVMENLQESKTLYMKHGLS